MITRAWILLFRFLLWLRYRVRLRGAGAVAAKGRTGILFLPNHPALIDPVILTSQFYSRFGARPLADRDQIGRFGIRYLAKRVGAIPIPDLAKAGAATAAEVKAVVGECVEALRRGDNLIVYPAGRIYRSRFEDIGGASAVETICREVPGVRIVLVRTRGLWGSSSSRASGEPPRVGNVLKLAAKTLAANGLLFAPRRTVDIEMIEPADLPLDAGRGVLNRTLEAFYNADAPANTYVPYSHWETGGVRELPDPTPPRVEGDLQTVPPETRKLVIDYLHTITGCDKTVADDARLAHELGMDSLCRSDLLLWLQSEFGFPTGDTDSVQTVGDVMLAACGVSTAAGVKTLKAVPRTWFTTIIKPPKRPPALGSMTIAEAFLLQARRSPDKVIMADQTSGVRTYREVVTGILALQGSIADLPGEHVGIMMPASVGASILYLATMFAGKTPVMVNWTAGRKNVKHGLDAVGVEVVLTARAVVTQLQSQGVDLGDVVERFVCLEDIASRLTRRAKLAAWVRGRLSWRRLTDASLSPIAAVLFTSGSESLPKTVPLTHRNILTNVSDAWDCFDARADERILCILPPFHSFGLTASMILPLCTGIRVVFYPNPTDAGPLGQIIEAYQVSMLFGTPTFLHGIVRASRAEQLRSLQLVVSGAEKCTERVYRAVAKRCPQTTIAEGYGVTECSPVVTCNHESDPRPGTIGRLMGALTSAVVDPDSGRRVERGSRGMLLVRGPSVFDGYADHDGPSPFVQWEGRSWYRTGDLVVQDGDGVFTFAGRMKRFVKLGGEMISLPAIEAVLDSAYDPTHADGPVLAVAADGDEQRPELVLFASIDVDRKDANATLRTAGLSPLHNIRRVIRIDELPVLGTGKTDYRSLNRRLAEEADRAAGDRP